MTDLGTARPHIASYVILRKDDKVAMLLRENTSWMAGHYGLPAGKVEKDEPYTLCAIREAREEAGVKLSHKNLWFVHAMHRKSDDDMYWVDLFFEATSWQGEPFNAEPAVHAELKWIDVNKLPKNTVPNVRYALKQIESGSPYSEFGWS